MPKLCTYWNSFLNLSAAAAALLFVGSSTRACLKSAKQKPLLAKTHENFPYLTQNENNPNKTRWTLSICSNLKVKLQISSQIISNYIKCWWSSNLQTTIFDFPFKIKKNTKNKMIAYLIRNQGNMGSETNLIPNTCSVPLQIKVSKNYSNQIRVCVFYSQNQQTIDPVIDVILIF